MVRDRDETETFGNYVSRPSRDRNVETETRAYITADSADHAGISATGVSKSEMYSGVCRRSDLCTNRHSLYWILSATGATSATLGQPESHGRAA